ncbi:hypothetical protein K4K49_010087 [Colletotrichum sp. SAR 10_70]|nr:hypothetical protein K4K50_010024 [Colletotrichum sp. SAR 10_71]KAI8153857.1 hypothetical protein K4K49_010087 [Colletotrichum sp. SAR 10_70]
MSTAPGLNWHDAADVRNDITGNPNRTPDLRRYAGFWLDFLNYYLNFERSINILTVDNLNDRQNVQIHLLSTHVALLGIAQHRAAIRRTQQDLEVMLTAIDNGTPYQASDIAWLNTPGTLMWRMALLAEIQWCWAWEDSQ